MIVGGIVIIISNETIRRIEKLKRRGEMRYLKYYNIKLKPEDKPMKIFGIPVIVED